MSKNGERGPGGQRVKKSGPLHVKTPCRHRITPTTGPPLLHYHPDSPRHAAMLPEAAPAAPTAPAVGAANSERAEQRRPLAAAPGGGGGTDSSSVGPATVAARAVSATSRPAGRWLGGRGSGDGGGGWQGIPTGVSLAMATERLESCSTWHTNTIRTPSPTYLPRTIQCEVTNIPLPTSLLTFQQPPPPPPPCGHQTRKSCAAARPPPTLP